MNARVQQPSDLFWFFDSLNRHVSSYLEWPWLAARQVREGWLMGSLSSYTFRCSSTDGCINHHRETVLRSRLSEKRQTFCELWLAIPSTEVPDWTRIEHASGFRRFFGEVSVADRALSFVEVRQGVVQGNHVAFESRSLERTQSTAKSGYLVDGFVDHHRSTVISLARLLPASLRRSVKRPDVPPSLAVDMRDRYRDELVGC